ncbi:MAG: M48 family metallopeptidase [Nibricoccus sp.]
MDFFQAQATAQKRTKKLIALFVIAVAATIAAIYLLLVVALGQLPAKYSRHGRYRQHSYDYYYEQPSATAPAALKLWDPQLFVLVAGGTILVIAGASIFKTFQLRSGGPAVAEMVGGRPVDPQTTDLKEKRLLNVVEEMSIASSIPVPAVYVLDDEPGLNAFAAGLTTNDAVVAVTRGTLDKLNRDELQGVVAHEFSHILNGDMRLNIRLVSVLFGIFVLTIIGRGLIRSIRFTGGNRSKKDGRIVVVILVIGVVLMVIGYIGYFFGRLIQAAVSRQREFLADASSVQFTRNPGGITGALKKIGGYALGGRIHNARAAAISHFFFAEAMSSGLTGLLATHPPLDKRILAIDPQFDGKYFEPTETIDITKESFVSAGLVPPPIKRQQDQPSSDPALRVFGAVAPALALASIGTLTPEQVSNAQTLLDEIPARLRQAARLSGEAPALIYSLLLDSHAELRNRQLALLPTATVTILHALAEPLASLQQRHKIPLCQLAQPALRELSDSELADFFATLDALIKADARVTLFEFALQKLLHHQLLLSKKPKLSLGSQIFSFQAMSEPITIVLSAVAHASTQEPGQAERAFAAGANLLKTISPLPELLTLESCDPRHLDPALDKLAHAAGPIKQRLLQACAQAASVDGQILVGEAELLRAFAACLDCPMPALGASQEAA